MPQLYWTIEKNFGSYVTAGKELTYLYLFSQDCQDRCKAEIKNVVGDRRPEAAHMQQLPYTMVCFSLRLHLVVI